jgi:hypothetical protein
MEPGANVPLAKFAPLRTALIEGVVASTTSVTATVCGLLLAPGTVIVIAPLYVPGFNPAGFTDTLKLAGVIPLVGLADSQLPPDADTVKPIAELAVKVTA